MFQGPESHLAVQIPSRKLLVVPEEEGWVSLCLSIQLPISPPEGPACFFLFPRRKGSRESTGVDVRNTGITSWGRVAMRSRSLCSPSSDNVPATFLQKLETIQRPPNCCFWEGGNISLPYSGQCFSLREGHDLYVNRAQQQLSSSYRSPQSSGQKPQTPFLTERLRHGFLWRTQLWLRGGRERIKERVQT